MIDTPEWFGSVPKGCDVPHWIPYMTADECGLDTPKLMIDRATDEIAVSYSTTADFGHEMHAAVPLACEACGDGIDLICLFPLTCYRLLLGDAPEPPLAGCSPTERE